MEIKIRGLEQVDKKIKEIEAKIKASVDLRIAREPITNIVQNHIKEQLDSQGKGKWPPLAKSTKKEKQRRGFGNKPILERTGRMRRTLLTRAETTTSEKGRRISIKFSDVVAARHQQGGGRLPQRKVLEVDEKLTKEIAQAYDKAVGKELKK